MLEKNGEVLGRGHPICRTAPSNSAVHYNIDAEIVAIIDALQHRYNPAGATLHLTGHWWSCAVCETVLTRFGITNFCIDPYTARTNPECRHQRPQKTTQ